MQQEGVKRNEYFMIGKKAKKNEELLDYDEGESGSEFISPFNALNGQAKLQRIMFLWRKVYLRARAGHQLISTFYHIH